jgi:NAD+ diphosphatase
MEVSESYRHCPICGVSRVASASSRPFRCHACGYTSFFGPVAAVGGVITNAEGQILLIERAKDPGRGKLGMPGGFVDPYESSELALRREIREEVGLEVGELTFLMTASNSYVYQGIVNPVLDIFYTAQVLEGQSIQAEATEVSSWMWTDPDRNTLQRMAFDSNRQAIAMFIKGVWPL